MSTYDRLLTLADSLIQKNGFEGFSYADLAAEMGIRKASIHHHFPTKSDIGLAYCDRKTRAFLALEQEIQTLPVGLAQIEAYIDAFRGCASEGMMCGVYAMLSDSNLFAPPLQDAVSELAATELRILTGLLTQGRDAGQLHFSLQPAAMAVIICNTVKGALMLNRTPPHNAYAAMRSALLELVQPAK